MAEELKETDSTTTQHSLNFCILDYGIPHIYGCGPSFWIACDGSVQTQEIQSAKSNYKYIRHKYKLDKNQLLKLTSLLNTLRKDNKVLKERYFIPGEHIPSITFSINPHSDLYIREKLDNDVWINFTEVSHFLHETHQLKTRLLAPHSTGVWTRDMVLWQPAKFLKRETVDVLRHSNSEKYTYAIEHKKANKSQ
jgi:hypothetical protein